MYKRTNLDRSYTDTYTGDCGILLFATKLALFCPKIMKPYNSCDTPKFVSLSLRNVYLLNITSFFPLAHNNVSILIRKDYLNNISNKLNARTNTIRDSLRVRSN